MILGGDKIAYSILGDNKDFGIMAQEANLRFCCITDQKPRESSK